jgi:O-antigen/teichoic acid export membrane protein
VFSNRVWVLLPDFHFWGFRPWLEQLHLSSFQRFISNISWNVLGKVCVQILLFGVSVLLARYLGKEKLGIYATLLVVPTFVRLLNQLGLETLINKKIPELNVLDPSGKQARYLIQRLLAIRLGTSLLFSIALYVGLPHYMAFMGTPELLEYRLVLILYFLIICINSLLSTLFMTQLRYRVVSITETGCALLNLVFLAGFILQDWGIKGVLYAYIISTFINIFIYTLLIGSNLQGKTEAPDLKELPSLAWASYLLTIFSFGLITQSDVMLMNYFQVAQERIGFYHLATGLGGMLAFIMMGVGPMAFSILSESYTRNSLDGMSKIWCQVVGFASFLTVPIFVFAFFNAEPLIQFIYGEQFKEAGAALAFYIIFLGIATILGVDFVTSTLFILERRDTVIWSNAEGSFLNICLNLILIPLYGEIGALAATGTAMIYMVLRQLYIIQKQMDMTPVLPVLGKCLFFSFIAVVPAQLAALLIWQNIFFSALVFLSAFIIFLAILKPFSRQQLEVLEGIHPELPFWLRGFAKV